jgi:predicted amidohydrolase YtcJ
MRNNCRPQGDCDSVAHPVKQHPYPAETSAQATWGADSMKIGSMALLAVLLASGAKLSAEPVADTVYRHGRIYTVDRAHPWADAVAIKDGKFSYVGTDKGVQAYIGGTTKVIDLAGKFAMPGLHDAHQHMLKGEARYIYCQIAPESRIEQIVASLKSCSKDRQYGGWIVADVYRGDLFPDGHADRKYLDAAFPDTPVYIREWSYHHGLANTKALQIAGVDRATADPEGGRVLHRADGEPTGEFLSKATWLITQHIPALPAATVDEALLRTAALCAEYGITSAQEATASRQMLEEMRKLDLAGKWTLRTATHIVWGNPASALMPPQETEEVIAHRKDYATSHIFTDFVKIYVDGSPLQPHSTDVELDDHGEVAVARLYEKPAVLNAALTRFDKMGIKVKMHAVGSGAIRTALDAIEAARTANGNSGILHDVAHSLRYSPQDIDRPARLGAVGEMSPAIWQIKGPLTKNLAGAWPFKSLLARGTLMTLGSDWVVLPAPNLFPAIGGMLDHGPESIGLKDAIEIATINGAKSVGWDKVNGSIEVGKFANMIVLDRDLFKIPAADIGETKVLSTVFEGREVYARPQ